MRNCTTPLRDSEADYDLCVHHSRRPRKTSLQARRGSVFQHYGTYAPGGGRAHVVPRSCAWPADEADWQRALYDNTYEGRRLDSIRAAALEAAGNQCLLCSVTATGSLDHFLPRESFPSLSLFALNLIAACDDCNRTKGTAAHTDPARQFVHPYLDPLPLHAPFLRCIPFAGAVLSPEFSIIPCQGVDADLETRLRWQFTKLDLNTLYSDQAVFFFRECHLGWQELAAAENGALVTDLERTLRSATSEFGCNRWKPAFLRGLLEHADFLADPLAYLG